MAKLHFKTRNLFHLVREQCLKYWIESSGEAGLGLTFEHHFGKAIKIRYQLESVPLFEGNIK